MKGHTIVTLIVVALVVFDLVGYPLFRTFAVNSPGFEGWSWSEFQYWRSVQEYWRSVHDFYLGGLGGLFLYLVLLVGGNILVAIVNYASRSNRRAEG